MIVDVYGIAMDEGNGVQGSAAGRGSEAAALFFGFFCLEPAGVSQNSDPLNARMVGFLSFPFEHQSKGARIP